MKRLAILLLLICAANASAEWRAYSPQGSVDGKGILRDVLSRSTKADYFQSKYASDWATCCHETTHDVNARISNEAGAAASGQIAGETMSRSSIGTAAFYVGGGRAMVLFDPKISREQVIQNVANSYQSGPLWDLYFIQQGEAWRVCRLYALDEWSASINGWQAAAELGVSDTGDKQMALQFCHYADAVVAATQQFDAQYRQMTELVEFVTWQKARVAKLLGGKPVPAQIVARPVKPGGSLSCLIQLDPKYRQHNDSGMDCVHCSVVNLLRINGLWKEADQFWQRYGQSGPDNPPGLAAKLKSMGLHYQMTTRPSKQFIIDAIKSGRGVAVGLRGNGGNGHVLNAVGCDDKSIVLMGNQVMDRNQTESWSEFMQKHDGWAFVITSGSPPKAETK